MKVRWAKREASSMRMNRAKENIMTRREELRKMKKAKVTRRKARRRRKRWKGERTRRMKMNLA